MSIEDALIERERQWMEAVRRHDADALGEILATEYTMTSSTGDGTLIHREECISWVTSSVVIKSFSFDKVHLVELDDVAVLKMELTHHADLDGEDWSHTFLITDVWVNRDGRWQVCARHSSLPGTARQAA